MKKLIKDTKVDWHYDENEAFDKIFGGIVQHHLAIIRFSKVLQSVLGGQLTLSLFMTAIIVCTTAIEILSIESPRKHITELLWMLVFVSIIVGNLFADCYFGNAITDKSVAISTLAYASPWINTPTKIKRKLIIFIAKTQQPIVLTAAKLTPVSLQTFTMPSPKVNTVRLVLWDTRVTDRICVDVMTQKEDAERAMEEDPEAAPCGTEGLGSPGPALHRLLPVADPLNAPGDHRPSHFGGVSGARHRRADADEVVDVFSRVPMTLSGSDASLPDVSSSSEDDEDAVVMDVLAPRRM
ncbi:unnamed protein product [Chilo suppressalis]|uniref:Odorant receptor n=1 Tax=Chilo suppressalis TaxID=168631 RepID=A0ABN8AZB0_CHISP|nr:unnamed protein product [Chilo suppressalis]